MALSAELRSMIEKANIKIQLAKQSNPKEDT